MLDFSSPENEVILPPLETTDIRRLSETANELYSKCACYLIESEREALKMMRYFASVMNGHIKGYEKVSAEAARILMCKSALSFRPRSTFLITEWFLGLCVSGDGQQAVRFFNQHKKILLRPYRYPMSSSKVYGIENYIEFINTPCRLCDGIAWSLLKQGNSDVLNAFLNDSQVCVLLEQRRFIKQLCEQLDGSTTKIAAHAYASVKPKNVKLFQSYVDNSVVPSHQPCANDNSFRMNEQVMIDFSLRRWDRYYDDRNVILRAILDARTHRKILAGLGYGYDLLVSERAVRIDKEAAQWLSPQIRKDPAIRAALEE